MKIYNNPFVAVIVLGGIWYVYYLATGLNNKFGQVGAFALLACFIFTILMLKSFLRYRARVGVGLRGEKVVSQLIEEMGFDALHDVYLPSDRGLIQLDHIVLFPGSLAVIETKTYSGKLSLYSERNWLRSARYGTRKYELKNPIWQLKAQEKHLKSLFPNLHIWGNVVLAGRAKIIDGNYPYEVKSLVGFKRYLAQYKQRKEDGPVSEEVSHAWSTLKQMSVNSKIQKHQHQHLRDVRKKRGDFFYFLPEYWPMLFLAAGALATASVWLSSWHSLNPFNAIQLQKASEQPVARYTPNPTTTPYWSDPDKQKGNHQKLSFPTMGSVNQRTNIRKTPSLQAKILGQFESGSSTSLIGKQGDWYVVRFDDKPAYIHESFVILWR